MNANGMETTTLWVPQVPTRSPVYRMKNKIKLRKSLVIEEVEMDSECSYCRAWLFAACWNGWIGMDDLRCGITNL